jgi:polysaccharide export outer membrane protein
LNRRLARLSLAIGISALASPGCTPRFERAPTVPTQTDLFAQVDSLVPAGLPEDPALPAQLFPGDVITLVLNSATREEEPNLRVDDRGVVHVPLAGDVEVAGITLTEAEQRLETALRQYNPSVRVAILLTAASGHMATVVGAVGTPGRVEVTGGMRLVDLIALVGGPLVSEESDTTFSGADLGAARLVRNGTALPISVNLALTGDLHHNVRIHPGDVLHVPRALQQLVTVFGEVEAPAVMMYRPGLRISQAVAVAGGVTRDGDAGDVRVIRGDSEHPRIYQAGISDIVDGRSPDVVLAPGDIVYVSSSAHADLRDVMSSISTFLSLGTTGAAIVIPSVTR